MKKYQFLFAIVSLVFFAGCTLKPAEKEYKVETHKDANGYAYETVTNDPTGLRLYTLDNGLKVYLSQNTDEPKIQTFIAVRAGSNYDPKDATGLAHYLEHMLFKGTDKIGSSNWKKEKKLLDKISDLYEKHKQEKNPAKKKAIYRKIDRLSLEASKYSIANEYDKMVSSMGAEGTNAHTWVEETIYKNKIPANELVRWLKLEKERFGMLVLRLFHTELEVVYEEFNRGQDNDFRKRYAAKLKGLFPTHPYGQQTTIGTSDHLKNPSMKAIYKYFDKYYVPNNMAMVLVGDLDFDTTIKMVDNTFGKLKKKKVTHPKLPKEAPIEAPIVKEVFGPTAENLSLAFRTNGMGSKDELLTVLVDMILNNSVAGLFDLNLNQKQKVLRAGSYPTFFTEYGVHTMTGTPKSGQSLEEVKDLILGQIEKIKKGEFDDWLLGAIVNDLKLTQLGRFENSSHLASSYYNAFIHHQDWKDRIRHLDDLKKITKQEVMDFVKNNYTENYVVVYKRKGVDKNVAKVENPKITPVKVNRSAQSEFLKEFENVTTEPIQPKYVDFKSEIKTRKLKNGLRFDYIPNKNNDIFSLNIIFDMGKDHNKMLSLALGYLNYLGTKDLSPEEVKKEFYKLGISYSIRSGNDQSFVSISGLKENFHKGLKLLENLWSNVVADKETYEKYVGRILKSRKDAITHKRNILWTGLFSYGKYGENSRLRNIYTEEELQAMDPEKLVEAIKDLRNYKQRIFYYGKDVNKAISALNKLHKLPKDLKEYPKPVKYDNKATGKKVYFTNYDMVQSEMIFVSKGEVFDAKKFALSSVFNSYFGSGLSSIVFQEIRESKSLAYSAFSAYANARKKEEPDYVYAYIGTQANKLPEAVNAMLKLMKKMPKAEKQFKAAKESVLKRIAAERITKANIFWRYEGLKDRGLEEDIREAIYSEVQKMTLNDLANFFDDNIKESKYTVLVIGNKKDMKMWALRKLGKVSELEANYLFNY